MYLTVKNIKPIALWLSGSRNSDFNDLKEFDSNLLEELLTTLGFDYTLPTLSSCHKGM